MGAQLLVLLLVLGRILSSRFLNLTYTSVLESVFYQYKSKWVCKLLLALLWPARTSPQLFNFTGKKMYRALSEPAIIPRRVNTVKRVTICAPRTEAIHGLAHTRRTPLTSQHDRACELSPSVFTFYPQFIFHGFFCNYCRRPRKHRSAQRVRS